jgi:PAS domain S-box-containing protein
MNDIIRINEIKMTDQTANILIVDDKESNLFILEELLSKKGRKLIKALNGNDALKLLLVHQIDLIIIDVHMPDMDGFEVAQIVKSNTRTQDIPIIFATAERKGREFVMRGFQEGAVDYLTKPLDSAVTRAKVDILLQMQFQKKELQHKNKILEKYELLINNCADLICIIDETTLKFEEVNDAFKNMLGYELDEIKGTSMESYISEDNREHLKKIISEDASEYSFEMLIRCKDHTQKWLDWNIVKNGRKWFASARDITISKQITKIQTYLSAVVELSNNAIYLYDLDGSIISWNAGAEKMYGYSESEALHMPVRNLIPDSEIEKNKKSVEAVLKGEKIAPYETKHITKSGDLIDVVFGISGITEEKGVVKSIAATERDITNEKVAENLIQQQARKLKESNVELEQFAYVASHDLQEPLRTISNFVELLKAKCLDKKDSKTSEYIKFILDATSRMQNLIKDLLELSRIGRTISIEAVDCNKVLNNVIAEMGLTIKESNAKITFSELPVVQGNEIELKQLFQNLLSNAIKFRKKNTSPEIKITVEENTAEYFFAFSDNGIGIDPQFREKIFIIFQRLHTSTDYPGTGIGLATCKKIVDQHQGRIWVESAFNNGSTFYFTIPKNDGIKLTEMHSKESFSLADNTLK